MNRLDEEKKTKAKFLVGAAALGILSASSFLISTRWMTARGLATIVLMAVLMGLAER